jgi:thymidine kinase
MQPGISARNAILAHYKKNAKQAGRVWEISEEKFDLLTSAICHYCGAKPTNTYRLSTGCGEFTYNGLDRKDSSKGYMEENVVSCCKTCQKCKSSMPYDEFLAFLRRAGEFQLNTAPLSRGQSA